MSSFEGIGCVLACVEAGKTKRKKKKTGQVNLGLVVWSSCFGPKQEKEKNIELGLVRFK